MLKKLHIEQFVIIDTLDLDLQPGLTILTGETGAGKSILLDAMGLILGEPSNPDSIRQGQDRSLIRATLTPSERHPVWHFLKKNDIAATAGEAFTIERIITRGAPDRITLNGQTLDLELLQQIGTYLVEIHGQFANQSLLEPANQLRLLDLSGAFPPEIFKNVADALHEVHHHAKALEEEKLFLARHQRELPKIEETVRRFDNLGMKVGFIKFVQEDYERLLTAKGTSEAFQSILGQLIASNGVVITMSSLNNILNKQKNLDRENVASLSNLLSGALQNARNAVTELRRLAPAYEIDTEPLHKYKAILNELQAISKEAKIPFEELEDYYKTMSARMERMHKGRETLKNIDNALAAAKNSYREHAHILTQHRIAAGKKLSDAITAEFPPLKLDKAEFKVEVTEDMHMEWTDHGINIVTFTARMNPGMPFSPVVETASGGEMARMILGLKVVLQRVQTTPTLVFDEVDTGIGGSAAAAVGERLVLLAEATQVLVITHSPQVASRGNVHLHVSKKTDGVTTTSAVRTLSQDERIEELSRMLAGDEVTDESNAAARRLVQEAQNSATKRTHSG